MVGFDEQRLLGAAAAHLGVAQALEPTFRPAFCALLTGLREEARLSQVGAWRAGARLMGALGQRVALTQFEAQTPELAQVELAAPIFVTGLPRRSTSMLHNLLARTPTLWAPRLWELHRPVPPARIDERWIDRQIRTTEALLEQLYDDAPELRRLHPLSATAPESCSWLFRNNFSSLVHAFHWYMPSYVEFMLETELGAAYRDHRRFLRVLAHRHRHDDLAGPQLVLEDPWHMWQLEPLLEVYPDAWIIVVRAEPELMLESLARSCWTLQQVDARRPRSPAEIHEYCERMVDAGLVAFERARDRVAGGRLIEVDHADLVHDPLGLVRSLGARLRLPSSPAGLRDASRWLADERLLRPGARGPSPRPPARLDLGARKMV